MDPKTEKGTDPAICALDILRGIARREYETYVGQLSSIIYLQRFFPRLLYHILLRIQTA
jgi:hypothetical protein